MLVDLVFQLINPFTKSINFFIVPGEKRCKLFQLVNDFSDILTNCACIAPDEVPDNNEKSSDQTPVNPYLKWGWWCGCHTFFARIAV